MRKLKLVPGTLLKNKETGELVILEHTYEQAFGNSAYGGCTISDLSICHLDDKGNINNSSAWHSSNNFEVIESDIEANIEKIVKYNNGGAAPISMNPDLARKLGYGSIHTYNSSCYEEGEIKL